jgi:peptide-methionine (R)-S-oxide reductase
MQDDHSLKKVVRTAEQWRQVLSPEQFRILRQKGTERAFTGKYHDHKGQGVYRCAGCGLPLFNSNSKYDSGSGWPSYWTPIDERSLTLERDETLDMERVEVLCARCGGHLGHVFRDGPPPTGLRYCINSAALEFVVPAKP